MGETVSFFTDGQTYDKFMGRWSRAIGEIFVDWLSLPKGQRWLDVGCGTGVFSEVVLERCVPAAMSAIDAAPDQVAYAQSRFDTATIAFRVGDARNLPYADDEFDVAAMALVIAFIDDPGRTAAEMKRVVRPGGTIAAYTWDTLAKGFVQEPLREALAAMTVDVPAIAGATCTTFDALRRVFEAAGLAEISTRAIEITVAYGDFEEFWSSQTALPNNFVRVIRAMDPIEVDRLQAYLRVHLPRNGAGSIAYPARANAIKGRVPL